MPFAPRGWGSPPKSSNWRQQGAPRVCRDWGGALTFRGMLAGCGRLDVQGGEPTFWKLPGPPHSQRKLLCIFTKNVLCSLFIIASSWKVILFVCLLGVNV